MRAGSFFAFAAKLRFLLHVYVQTTLISFVLTLQHDASSTGSLKGDDCYGLYFMSGDTKGVSKNLFTWLGCSWNAYAKTEIFVERLPPSLNKILLRNVCARNDVCWIGKVYWQHALVQLHFLAVITKFEFYCVNFHKEISEGHSFFCSALVSHFRRKKWLC